MLNTNEIFDRLNGKQQAELRRDFIEDHCDSSDYQEWFDTLTSIDPQTKADYGLFLEKRWTDWLSDRFEARYWQDIIHEIEAAHLEEISC